jgi:hypothetical protein
MADVLRFPNVVRTRPVSEVLEDFSRDPIFQPLLDGVYVDVRALFDTDQMEQLGEKLIALARNIRRQARDAEDDGA